MPSASCLCGSVRITVDGDLEHQPEACHCVQCRKQTGSFLTGVNVRRTALTIARHIQIADPPVARSEVPIKFVFRSLDVKTTRRKLAERGAHMGDLQKLGSLTLCDAIDPEDNVFQISNRP